MADQTNYGNWRVPAVLEWFMLHIKKWDPLLASNPKDISVKPGSFIPGTTSSKITLIGDEEAKIPGEFQLTYKRHPLSDVTNYLQWMNGTIYQGMEITPSSINFALKKLSGMDFEGSGCVISILNTTATDVFYRIDATNSIQFKGIADLQLRLWNRSITMPLTIGTDMRGNAPAGLGHPTLPLGEYNLNDPEAGTRFAADAFDPTYGRTLLSGIVFGRGGTEVEQLVLEIYMSGFKGGQFPNTVTIGGFVASKIVPAVAPVTVVSTEATPRQYRKALYRFADAGVLALPLGAAQVEVSFGAGTYGE